MAEVYKDREWMLAQFAIPGKTIAQIADTAGVNEKTIRRWQKRLNVASHTIAEQAWYRQAQHAPLSERAMQIIEGSLLGDGNLTSSSQWSATYQQNTSNLAFAELVKNELEQEGIKSSKIIPYISTGGYKTTNMQYALRSLSHTAMKSIYDNWYGTGKKVVPTNLILTPLIALYWYLGDGCYCGVSQTRKGYRAFTRIATDGFHLSEVKFLTSQLTQFKPRINRMSSKEKEGYGYRIVMETSFLEWIGTCPESLIDSYGYKWGPDFDKRKPR